MDTDGIKLPNGGIAECQFIDGMREVCWYDIRIDGFRSQWDTNIRGERRSIRADPPYDRFHSMSSDNRQESCELKEWVTGWRAKAKAAFEAEEAGH
jgi:hypothetical protein